MMIVIVIIGILTGSALQFSLGRLERANADATEDNLKTVQEALAAHIARAGFLPCPARRDALPGTAAFGAPGDCTDTATVDIGECADGYCVQAGRAVDHDDNPATADVPMRVRVGAVPTRALNMPFSIMADGWNNQITYAVTEMLARTPEDFSAWDGGIAVVDEADNSVVTPPETASYVLVSHGNDRAGAVSFLGGVTVAPCPAGGAFAPKDQENCNFTDDPAVFRAALFSQAEGSRHFDDSVSYVAGIEPAAGSEPVGSGGCIPGSETFNTPGVYSVLVGSSNMDCSFAISLVGGHGGGGGTRSLPEARPGGGAGGGGSTGIVFKPQSGSSIFLAEAGGGGGGGGGAGRITGVSNSPGGGGGGGASLSFVFEPSERGVFEITVGSSAAYTGDTLAGSPGGTGYTNGGDGADAFAVISGDGGDGGDGGGPGGAGGNGGDGDSPGGAGGNGRDGGAGGGGDVDINNGRLLFEKNKPGITGGGPPAGSNGSAVVTWR